MHTTPQHKRNQASRSKMDDGLLNENQTFPEQWPGSTTTTCQRGFSPWRYEVPFTPKLDIQSWEYPKQTRLTYHLKQIARSADVQ
ncbi:hypothetical protein VTK56DRAFT_10174 [Thermocarpiscus australiensis]